MPRCPHNWMKCVAFNADSLNKETLETTLTVLLKHESDVFRLLVLPALDDVNGSSVPARPGRPGTW